MDLAILYWIQGALGCPFMNAAMPLITMLGEHGAVWIAIAIVLLVNRRYRAWGITMLIVMAAVYIVGMEVIKPLVARPRPFMSVPDYALLISPPSGYSFPSGHASISFAAATMLCFIPQLKKGWKIGAVVLAVLIAFSRLYLFVHYPTDVLAGAVLGIVAGVVAALVCKRVLASRTAKGAHASS